ncbi:MAG: hypothetical protein H5T43_05015 [Methanomethylovorans sp.]|nr:hypothetical protein [Methanomethylovorans sp.]
MTRKVLALESRTKLNFEVSLAVWTLAASKATLVSWNWDSNSVTETSKMIH